jgi:hypothetical protein
LCTGARVPDQEADLRAIARRSSVWLRAFGLDVAIVRRRPGALLLEVRDLLVEAVGVHSENLVERCRVPERPRLARTCKVPSSPSSEEESKGWQTANLRFMRGSLGSRRQ